MEEVILRIIDNSITGLIAVLLVWRLDRRLLELILEVREQLKQQKEQLYQLLLQSL